MTTGVKKMQDALRRALQGTISAVFPQDNLCQLCRCPLCEAGFLCDICQKDLNAMALPACDQPLFLDALLPRTYAAYRHDGAPRALVHRLKYQGISRIAFLLAEGMAQMYACAQDDALCCADLLVPVPLHPKRLRARGFNQAERLAARLAFHMGKECCPSALARIRHTRPQVGNTGKDRKTNMNGAFAVPNKSLVQGKVILLIDDVCTTGATAIACAEALLQSGAADVMLLTVCKA